MQIKRAQCPSFSPSNKIYNPGEIDILINEIWDEISIIKKGKIQYICATCAFDTETTSFYCDGEKRACMYVWMLGINGRVVLGRTWDECIRVFNTVSERFNLSDKRRLLCFVHNLAYDFQFFRKWFNFTRVFSMDKYKPLFAITDAGIEFRCSYLQSGYSLEYLGKHLRKYNVRKLTGDLDYNLIRHSGTPLTDKEIGYCVNDVVVLMAYICETAEKDGGLQNIPLTKTGYVRRYCREKCFEYRRGYYDIMRSLTLESAEYSMLKQAFQGGFTHANPIHSGVTLYDCASIDFISSYPATMITEQFPMGKGEPVIIHNEKEFDELLKYYAFVADITIDNLEPRLSYDNYISESKCWEIWGDEGPNSKKRTGVIINNGRVAYAKHIGITITDIDYPIIKNFYKWGKGDLKIGRVYRYKRDYLPTKFVTAILDLYQKKTELKGVDGMETEYLVSKEMLNSCYGMAVTNIVRPEWVYNNEWPDKPDTKPLDDEIENYNKNPNRFLSYAWGVWVTAYARRNLFTGIIEFKDDYIYSDTDSIKCINIENHMEYINRYNKVARERLLHAMKIHGIDPARIEPETIKGKKKLLGAWEIECYYKRFKTLGAKRYMVQYPDGAINITVSGINKKVAMPYIIKHYGRGVLNKQLSRMVTQPHFIEIKNAERIFKSFDNDLYIPPDYTGKKTHTYFDDEIEGYLLDYRGNRGYYHELSYIHLSPSDYHLSLSQDYVDFIMGIKSELQF